MLTLSVVSVRKRQIEICDRYLKSGFEEFFVDQLGGSIDFNSIKDVVKPLKWKQMILHLYSKEDGSPYYIGKGQTDRLYSKKGHSVPLPPRERIIYLKKDLTEQEAFKHEVYMISVYGRKDIGTGILRNRTDGGQGHSGLKQTEEHILKKTRRGWNHTEETKEKCRQTNLGRKHTQEFRERRREIMTRSGGLMELTISHRECSLGIDLVDILLGVEINNSSRGMR